jgi:hypothetical protein
MCKALSSNIICDLMNESRGPNAEVQWRPLLEAAGLDSRTGKPRSTPMLAMILAGAQELLQILYKVWPL